MGRIINISVGRETEMEDLVPLSEYRLDRYLPRADRVRNMTDESKDRK